MWQLYLQQQDDLNQFSFIYNAPNPDSHFKVLFIIINLLPHSNRVKAPAFR